MGLAASQGRFLMLTARKSDLEMQGQAINQKRMSYANMLNQYLNFASMSQTNDPESTQSIFMQSKIEQLEQIDKVLELSLRRVDTQQQAVQTEIQAVQKVIDKNIDMSFKTFA